MSIVYIHIILQLYFYCKVTIAKEGMETCVSYVTISLMPNLVRVVIVQCAVNVLLGPGNVRLAVYVGGKYNYIVCFRFPGLTAVCINLAAANQKW